MNGRLRNTIWTLLLAGVVCLIAMLGFAYSAGSKSGGLSMLDFGSLPSQAAVPLAIATVLCLGLVIALFTILGGRVLAPVEQLAEYSRKVAAGDSRASVDMKSDDEFALILGNFRRAAMKVTATASPAPEVQGTLQRSINQFLTVISQVARGDLTLRAKATNDSFGNVAEALNSMLDNFTQVLERASKAAGDVSTSANEILVASEQMASGATQQDQEITNTSSAVEELTVSMKQVSNNAEASAEAARRALEAAEQGNRSVRDTLEGSSASALPCKPPPRGSNRWATARSKFRKSST